MSSFDLLIVGAGIVGCACAREAALAGLHVGIIEAGTPGGAATAAGMGHIVVMDDSPAQLALTQYSRGLWQELIPELGPAVEYETRGTIWVAVDEEEMAEVWAKQKTYAAAGIVSEILDGFALSVEEPQLRSELAGGLLVPGDGVMYPPAAAGQFLREAMRHDAVLLRGDAAVKAAYGTVTMRKGTIHRADRILIATGTDISLVPSLPIQKRKGHLLITDRHSNFLHHQLVELGYLKSAHKLTTDSVAFNVQPRSTGQLLIGSSRQYGNDDPGTESHILHGMLERACEYMPGLADVSAIRTWTGFRAATADKLPLIGATEDRTVYLAMGFEGLGITNSTGAARLVLDGILGRTSAIDAAPFLPSRLRSSVMAHA